jgi:glutamine amidotransferase
MSKSKVVIIDYGVGNLLSVQRAVEACGAQAITSSDPKAIALAERLILPGVGAFANGMNALTSLGLVDVIRATAADGVPLLGICLGMQLLFNESEEYGLSKGLGIISGRVLPLPAQSIDGSRLKIPLVGWYPIAVAEGATWNQTILENLNPRDAFYFVHSYMAVPDDPAVRIADCIYGGNRIPAVVESGNVYGCQFHPEKSQYIGLRMIANFLTN